MANRPPSSCTIGPEIRRDHRDGVEHHAQRRRATFGEVRHDLQTLDRLQTPRPLAVLDLVAERLGLGLDVHVGQQALDGFGAHASVEEVTETLPQAAVDVVVRHQLLHVQALERGEHVVEVLGVASRHLMDALHVTLCLALRGRQLCALRALGLELLQPVLELVESLLDVDVALGLDVTLLGLQLGFDLGQAVVASLVIDPRDHVGREVDDPLEVLRGQVEQVAQP